MIGQNPYNGNISPLNELKSFFRKKDTLSRLILINVVVFTLINIVSLFFYLLNIDQEFVQLNGVNRFTYLLSLPSDIFSFLLRPWSLITYMFVQEGVFHLFFNMLILYVGGQIFNRFIGSSKLLSVYILSGITGAILYMLTFNIFPAFGSVVNTSFAIGSSAAVLGIFVAAATFVPNLEMNVILFGNVKLKYIAILFIVLDILNIRNANAGGHIAHIGGALYGYFYINQLKKNIDYSLLFNKYWQSIYQLFKKKEQKTPFQNVHRNHERPMSDEAYLKNKNKKQAEVNTILEKIKKSGYDSLTTDEKQKLFKASRDS